MGFFQVQYLYDCMFVNLFLCFFFSIIHCINRSDSYTHKYHTHRYQFNIGRTQPDTLLKTGVFS